MGDYNSYITFKDLIFIILIIPFIYLFLRWYKKKFEPAKFTLLTHSLAIKLSAWILLGLVYQFYYGFGDTFGYYRHSCFLTDMIYSHPLSILKYIFYTQDEFQKAFYFHFQKFDEETYFLTTETITIIKIAGLLNFFSFSTYYGTGFYFSIFSFWGLWKLVSVFTEAYPDISNKFSLIFYIPSLAFWSSGILKDPICLGSMGLIIYLTNRISNKPMKLLWQCFLIALLGYLILLIKSYIILCLLPPLFFWQLALLFKNLALKHSKIKLIVLTLSLLVVIAAALRLPQKIAALINPEDIIAYVVKNRISFNKDSNSDAATEVKTDEFNDLSDVVKLMPASLNSTLFRPYIWEAGGALPLFASLENLALMLGVVYVIYQVKVVNFFKISFKNRDVFFCLFFVVLFSIALGLVVTNYGALARFKIQMLPFLIIALVLIYHKKILRNNTKILNL